MGMDSISRQTARRFVLGRQGLWPGRRYQGKRGVAEAICASECVQVDTISSIARSHDLMLWSRVLDYDPAWLNEVCYRERLFFDYGTILMLYPRADLPYFQTVMRRLKAHLANAGADTHTVRQHVLEEIARRGPLANRDFTDRARIPGGFNVVKDTSKALYHLYLSGHVMTHSRRNFERVYDVTANIVEPATIVEPTSPEQAGGGPNIVGQPADDQSASEVSPIEADRFFACKAMRDLGLATAAQWARRASILQHERVPARQAAKRLEELVSEGALATIPIEGQRETHYLPAADRSLLHTLTKDDIPVEWTPTATTTTDEVNFLAPLDNVIWDRPRTQSLFDFEYVWEVYKPAPTRRWGYYTLPILFGDQLVGRIAPRLNRKTRTLTIEGFWLENASLETDGEFGRALALGLARFARFHGAISLDTAPLLNRTDCPRVLLSKVAQEYIPNVEHGPEPQA